MKMLILALLFVLPLGLLAQKNAGDTLTIAEIRTRNIAYRNAGFGQLMLMELMLKDSPLTGNIIKLRSERPEYNSDGHRPSYKNEHEQAQQGQNICTINA